MKLTSISALGVSAETESIQMRSTAPDLHMRSATDTQTEKINYKLKDKTTNLKNVVKF